MIKPNRPPEENGPSTRPVVSKLQSNVSRQLRFRSDEDFSDWIDAELDTLESLFAEFASKDSLRGYFSR
jgi:hypothetical protein